MKREVRPRTSGLNSGSHFTKALQGPTGPGPPIPASAPSLQPSLLSLHPPASSTLARQASSALSEGRCCPRRLIHPSFQTVTQLDLSPEVSAH